MKPQSQITACSIDHGEFIVLIPFNKKESSKFQLRDQYEQVPGVSAGSSISQFADSAWSEMVQDLSYLDDCSVRGREENGTERERESSEVGGVCSTSSYSSKGKGKRVLDGVMRNLLSSPTEGLLNERTCENFIKFLESVGCLSDSRNGKCMLAKQANSRCGSKKTPNTTWCSSCICPVWLKKVMKTFAFLNVFSMFLQLQEEIMTASRLEQAMDLLQKRGTTLCMEDIKHLSLLCPEVLDSVSAKVFQV